MSGSPSANVAIPFTRLLFIDESGGGGGGHRSISHLWTCAAVGYPSAQNEFVNAQVAAILQQHFRPRVMELKGNGSPQQIRRGSSLADVSRDVVSTLKHIDASVWVTAAPRDGNPLPSQKGGPPISGDKAIARHLLFERINGYLKFCRGPANEWLVIWDLSTPQELNFLNNSLRHFRDLYSGSQRHPGLHDAVTGGASYSWGGLQIADWFAHMALHYVGERERKADARSEKARNFREILWDVLQTNWKGQVLGVGFKKW